MEFKPAELARITGFSKTSVLRVSNELGIKPKRRGVLNERRYSKGQARKIIAEIERRRNPALALGARGRG